MKAHYSDREITVAIKGSEKERSEVIYWIYHNKDFQNAVFGYIRNNSHPQLAENKIDEIYRNGIMQLISNVIRGKYQEGKPIGAYLFGICRWIWIGKLKEKNEPLTEQFQTYHSEIDENSPENLFLNEEKKGVLKQLLEFLGEPCQSVLQLWTFGDSMKEIAEKVGYKSAGMARKKKMQCLRKLSNIVKDNPDLTTLLRD